MNTSYSSLAPLYDRVMDHVDYRQWCTLIKKVCKNYLPSRNISLFEIGGGTATLGRMLLAEGFDYQGSDRSIAMCRQAQQKGVSFFVADGRDLPCKGCFDCVIFLYDGINYLLDAADYSRLSLQVHSLLVQGGVFLFDITTETNSTKFFDDYMDFEDLGIAFYARHSYYQPTSRLQHNDFTIFTRDGDLYSKNIDNHVQRIFSVKEICSMLPGDLFEILQIWDGFTMRPYTPNSERIHFLLRKKDPA